MKAIIMIEQDELSFPDKDAWRETEQGIEEQLRDLLGNQEKVSALDVDTLSLSLDGEHTDWEKGEPCPECGSNVISVMQVKEERFSSEGGEFEFKKYGDAVGPEFSIVCGECVTRLARPQIHT
jgi:hypothetical protein